ncbi:MAG: hypothetical protein ABIV48_13270, partial [Pyrinomonadaceae bacterium]
FINTGVRPVTEDLGRFAETGFNGDRGSFKVPGLRNIEHRAPYMHNGRFATLEEVVAFYNRGGDFNAPNKAPAMQPLGLSANQMADLVTFLRRPLTDPRVTNQTGPFDQPTLYTETNRVPLISGTGRAGNRRHCSSNYSYRAATGRKSKLHSRCGKLGSIGSSRFSN